MADTASRGFTELTPEEERLKIRDISLAAESQSKEGETFYLITQRWWQQWLDYVNQDKINISNDVPVNPADSGGCASKRPSTIDNSDLIDDTPMKESSSTELHDTLVEGRDYILLPHEVWDQLKTWYGGGPTLPRKVINSGLSQMELAVEVYPLRLKLVLMPKGDKATIRISKKENIGELHRKACEIFDLNSEQVCIWDFYGHQKHALYDMDRTLDDANIQMDQDILVEVVSSVSSSASGDMLENGSSGKETSSRLLEPPKSSLSIAGGLSASNGAPKNSNSELKSQSSTASVKETDHVSGTPGVTTRGAIGGLTGLLNLGNTCFMNSAIQCLVHTPEFAKYFQEDYHQEINWQNPLGMVGELALAFGDLLRKLWAPGRTPIAPRPFKAKLARFAPQFSGYRQHDSQELLAFLLDGLHEDLNRVKHKPYMKSRDADGRPDEEVADEYWANHRARNDSIIVDVCQGQYKSTLVCPDCGKVSVTFDPFMYLSLPLQSPVTRPMTVTVFSTDGSALPNVCTVNVPKQGKCRDLLQALGTSCGLKSTEKLLLAEIRNHLIHRFFEDPLTPLTSIKDDDHLAAYKVSKVAKDVLFLHLIHRREDLESNTEGSRKGWKPYGTPLVLPVSYKETITRGDVQSLVRTTLSPLTRRDRGGATNSSLGDVLKTAELSQDTSETSTNSSEHSLASEKDSLGTLPLELVDENNTCVDLKVGEEKSIKFSSSSSMLVFIDWSQKLLEKYDTHYLENLREVAKNGVPSKKARSEPLSLYTCLEAFLREEPLVPEDMWFCPQCKEQRQASKKLDLWRLPEVLVIHLKRFSYSRSMKHKLETYVNFPVHDFDLTKYITSKNNSDHQLYELYALINHYGGMGSGHYTAHIKLLEENKWYNFDDNHISAMIEDEVRSSAAYVLFYRRVRRDDNLPPPIQKIKPQPPPSHKPPSRK